MGGYIRKRKNLGVWLFGLEDLTLTRDLELKQSLGEWVRV